MHKWIIEITDRVDHMIRYAAIRNFEDAGFVVVDKRFVGGPRISNPTAVQWRYTVQHHSKHAMMIHMLTVDANLFTVISEYSNA
jgi:hypothetical protein